MLGVLFFLVLSKDPNSSFPIPHLLIPNLAVFFILLFISVYFLAVFTLKSTIQGVLLGGVAVAFFLLRLLYLRSIFFVFLLLALFVTLELFLKKQ